MRCLTRWFGQPVRRSPITSPLRASTSSIGVAFRIGTTQVRGRRSLRRRICPRHERPPSRMSCTGDIYPHPQRARTDCFTERNKAHALAPTATETNVASGLRRARSDVTEAHGLDGVRLAIEVKPTYRAMRSATTTRPSPRPPRATTRTACPSPRLARRRPRGRPASGRSRS